VRVDAIYHGGRFWTQDAAHPVAGAVAVQRGRIIAVADDPAELGGLTPARRVDLRGAFVAPGFNDAHAHTAWYGKSLIEIPLATPPLRTLDDLYDRIARAAAEQPPGTWIIAGGYEQTKLGGGHPHRRELDRVAGAHLVWLKHYSGHMAVVNSRVLAAIGDAPVPDGGVVERDADGEPTGLLQEQAQGLVQALVYPSPVDELTDAVARAHRTYLAEGITSCQEAGVGGGWVGESPVEVEAYRRLRDRGELRVRTTLMPVAEALHPLPARAEDHMDVGLDLGIRSGFGDDWLALGAVKLFADGAVGGRTAAMHDDFADDPGNRGYLQNSEEWLRATITAAHRSGWQIASHAIGDRAVDVILGIYAGMLRDHPRTDARPRIEHCGVVSPEAFDAIRRLGVVPVPQGRFIGALGDRVRTILGERRAGWYYRQRSFVDAGVPLAGSSDRPVVDGAPLRAIHDMVNQRTDEGDAFNPAEALTAAQALRVYTLGSAYAAHQENDRGAITAGRLADFCVLADDLTTVDAAKIKDVGVLATVVGGDLAYDDAGFGA
jgi:hypothetical protein